MKKKLVMVRRLTIVCAVVLAVTAGLFLLLAWTSYRMRLSTEVIRVGIVCLYILPCILGGELLKRLGFKPSVLWGGGFGIFFYLLLCILSLTRGNTWQNLTGLSVPAICVLSGVLGSFSKRKSDPIT